MSPGSWLRLRKSELADFLNSALHQSLDSLNSQDFDSDWRAVREAEELDEIRRLQNEVKKLSKSLSNMTVDRNNLKDTADYALKKN